MLVKLFTGKTVTEAAAALQAGGGTGQSLWLDAGAQHQRNHEHKRRGIQQRIKTKLKQR